MIVTGEAWDGSSSFSVSVIGGLLGGAGDDMCVTNVMGQRRWGGCVCEGEGEVGEERGWRHKIGGRQHGQEQARGGDGHDVRYYEAVESSWWRGWARYGEREMRRYVLFDTRGKCLQWVYKPLRRKRGLTTLIDYN